MLKGENKMKTYDVDAVEYIAKLADGGLRDSLSLLDKCLSYSEELTVENIVKALGIANYDTMINLTDAILDGDVSGMIQRIEEVHASGVELKQFIRDYINFILDVNKYMAFGNFDFIKIPSTHENKDWLDAVVDSTVDGAISELLSTLINLNSAIKYDNTPKSMIECMLLEVMK